MNGHVHGSYSDPWDDCDPFLPWDHGDGPWDHGCVRGYGHDCGRGCDHGGGDLRGHPTEILFLQTHIPEMVKFIGMNSIAIHVIRSIEIV